MGSFEIQVCGRYRVSHFNLATDRHDKRKPLILQKFACFSRPFSFGFRQKCTRVGVGQPMFIYGAAGLLPVLEGCRVAANFEFFSQAVDTAG
ncbi:hypothetical protein AUC44_11105 [Deinococcus actinosclerus]|uniref:Uncharacterized protein n=1 Tax=Deinococcus actinosclerus TaxID=1768108 RepID=A0ABN4K5B0_9DEIO|nr:hypothetical protein AUC44_11105 [Deinococcus actinosclerus]